MVKRMNPYDETGSNSPRWLISALVFLFVLLALGTSYLAYQYFFGEKDASQVFPKYSQPKDLATAQLEQALQTSLQRHPEVLAYIMYRVGITNVNYSDDRSIALLWLALYDKDTDTLIPAEPGLAIAQRQSDKSWVVTVQADEGYNTLLEKIPDGMIDAETRTQYLSKPQELSKAGAPLHGYRLPWNKGVAKFLTGSIGHVLTYKSCPSSCMYAFDFADGGNFRILAAKGGRVKYAVWKYPDNNHTNANYIILEDDSTTPTTYQVYFHLSQNSIPEALRVKGTWVNQGQYIGNVDNTGYSSGPHLHFHVHANSTSYWGNSVDIVFDDVTVNGGRPRTCSEAKAFPTYGSECIKGDKYVSNNGDSKPPTGMLNAPAANTLVTKSTVTISGYGADETGVAKIQPMVKYDGTWRPAGSPIKTAAFVTDIDLCAAGVPDGPLSVGITVWDNGGNRTATPVGEVTIRKKFTCPILPPACSPAQNQAALYNNSRFQGYCVIIDPGEIADLSTVTDFGDNNLASIQLGGAVSAILFDETNFKGRTQALTSSSENLDDSVIGSDRVSSLRLVEILPEPTTPTLNKITGPNGNPLTADDSVILSWQPSAGALDYHVEVSGPDGYQAIQDWQAEVTYSLGSLKPGVYKWAVTARNSAGGKTTSGQFTVQTGKSDSLTPIAAPYEASFKNDVPGWTATGSWKRAGFKINSDNAAGWIFGDNTEYAQKGNPASGDLTSPAIFVGYAGQQFSFRSASSTESSGAIWDQRRVQISVDGSTFKDLVQITSIPGNPALFESNPVDLTPYVGKNVRFRFHFDTIDELYNTGLGWAITDVRVSDDPAKVCSESADDGTPDKSREVPIGAVLKGQICPAGDMDYFTFRVVKPQSFNASINITSEINGWQPTLTLLASDGKTIIVEASASGSSAQINTPLPEAGQYFLKVGAKNTGKTITPAIDYQLALVQDTTPPTVKLTRPVNGSISLKLPIALAAEASDGNEPVSRVEFMIQPAGASIDRAERVSVDETAGDGWVGSIPSTFSGTLEGAALFARAFDRAGNHADSNVVILAGDGSIPVTHMDAMPAEYGSSLVKLSWTAVSKTPIDHFELQYQINGGDWQAWTEPIDGNLNFASFFAKNGNTYGFRIRAVTASSEEQFPDEAQVKTTVEKECIPDKYEPGDNLPVDSPSLTSGVGQLHNLCTFKDEDWTSILLQGGKSYTFIAKPTELAAGVTLQLYDMTGKAMTDEARPEDLFSQTTLDFQPETSATYILRARAADEHLAGTRSIYSISYDQTAPFSPIPVVCGALLIPLLTALAKLVNRIRSASQR